MRQIREILRLKYEQGLRHRAIARACGVSVGTVSEYVQRAQRAGLGWPLPAELGDAALEARLFSVPEPSRERGVPDLLTVHQELKRPGVTLHLLWEEYRGVHPQGYGYSQFCELYRRWAAKLKPSMRQQHRAGEKTFIDFSGKRPHRRTGEEVPVELFVAALGASGYTYAEATRSQQLHDWVSAHTRMLEYFGGTSAIWVPDQLKSAVTQSCRYEPGVNQRAAAPAARSPRRARQVLVDPMQQPRQTGVLDEALVKNGHPLCLPTKEGTLSGTHRQAPREGLPFSRLAIPVTLPDGPRAASLKQRDQEAACSPQRA
jgi:transposase